MGFREQTLLRVSRQAPTACVLYLATALLSGICEVVAFPDRLTAQVVFFSFSVVFAALVYGVIRRHPERSVETLIVAVNVISVSMILYHGVVRASAEACLLVLTAALCTAAVMCHWGWRAQLTACIGAALVFPITLYTRLDASLPFFTLVVFLGCVIGLTAYGAAVLESLLFEAHRAREIAEEANRVKSAFLATMSHDLRTPMNIIFGMTEMMLDMSSDPEVRDCAQRTQRAASSLLSLVDGVLDLSRMEAGRLELSRRPFDLRPWLVETVEPLSLFARAKGLELDWDISPSVPAVSMGDPDRLRQVVVNLVTNAVKFTDSGRVVVRVEPDRESHDGAGLHFTVADTGIGISEAQQRRIFEPYVQAEIQPTSERSGAGLGLAICAQLVDLMGGRMWVESAIGRGSRFHFTATLAGDPQRGCNPSPGAALS